MDQKNHISTQLRTMMNGVPESIQKKVSNQAYIQHVHKQFKQVVSSTLLNHVNSVYLIPDNQARVMSSNEDTPKKNPKKLIVYVDSSICAAEFNARRELIILKYRELFNIVISMFEIRISKGRYRKLYPFIEHESDQKPETYTLTKEDYATIEQMISPIQQPKLKESFKKALIAQKQKNGNLQKK